jgi:hypothetical protein
MGANEGGANEGAAPAAVISARRIPANEVVAKLLVAFIVSFPLRVCRLKEPEFDICLNFSKRQR